jgi:hypothetical protein
VRGDWDGGGIKNVTVRACAEGRSILKSALTDANGGFRIENVPAGTYAVCVARSESWRPCVVTGIEVPEEGDAPVDVRVSRSFSVEADTWTRPYESVAQSYRATGLSLTGVRLKGFGGPRAVIVQVRDGQGPDAPALGPPRTTVPFGGEGTTSVVWSGGEVPTVPGNIYTIMMESPGGGWQPAMSGPGDTYPEGMAWFDGMPRPYIDLGVTVTEDNDTFATSVNIYPDNRYHRSISAGQSFIARSANVLYASVPTEHIDNHPVYVRLSIHEGGPRGTQIGPSKVASVGGETAVAWNRGEVSLVPGEPYGFHIESTDGRYFRVGVAKDPYAKGNAFFNGRPDDAWDLGLVITGDLGAEDIARLWNVPGGGESVPLANPSFEDGLNGWTHQGSEAAVVGCTDAVIPPWGEKMFGYSAHRTGEDVINKVFQEIAVKPGSRYTLSASLLANQAGGRSSDVMAQLFIYPGTADSFTDDSKVVTSGRYATRGAWRRASVAHVPETETILVGVELWQRFPLTGNALYVDGFHLQKTEDQ